MAVRELLHVANFFYEALTIARNGGENNEVSSSYGFGGQVFQIVKFRYVCSLIYSDFLRQKMFVKCGSLLQR